MEYTTLILTLPLLTFLALGLLGTKLKPATAGCIGTLSLAICALLAYMTAWQYFSMPRVEGVRLPVTPFNFEWLRFTRHLHIDLGIPGSSEIVRGVIERFCGKHGFKLIVKEMAKEGLAIPLVKQRLKRPICSACGKIKRHYFNKTALEEGFTALATGHNLDDEIARLFSNTLRWDVGYLSDQGPRLDGEDGFARKVKPFWRLTEFETATYAFLEEIEHHHTPCPYSAGASFTYYKGLWNQLEEEMPGRKLSFYVDFLKRGRSAFAGLERTEGDALAPCTVCGYPTSSGVCGVCRIREVVKEGKE